MGWKACKIGKVRKIFRQTGIEISYILNNLITVIFCYQISLKSLKTLSLSQVSFPLLFPLYYIICHHASARAFAYMKIIDLYYIICHHASACFIVLSHQCLRTLIRANTRVQDIRWMSALHRPKRQRRPRKFYKTV